MKRKASALLFLLLLLIPAGYAEEADKSSGITLAIAPGKVWLHASEGSVAPDPFETSFSARLELPLSSWLSFSPRVGFTTFRYFWSAAENRPLPAALETAGYLLLGTVMAETGLSLSFPIGPLFSLGGYLGPLFVLPFPLESEDGGSVAEIMDYFWGQGRFIYAAAGIRGDLALLPAVSLRLEAGALLPLFHIWETPAEGFSDYLMVEASLGILFHL